MNDKKNIPDKEHKQQHQAPFEKDPPKNLENTGSDKDDKDKITPEDLDAEQQYKEAMTERD